MGKWSVSGHDMKGFLAVLLFLYSLLLLLLKKKSATELTASVLKKNKKKEPKHTRDEKDAFLIGRNRTKRANSRGSPLFQATYNIKTEEKTKINSTYLVSVNVGGWRKDEPTQKKLN